MEQVAAPPLNPPPTHTFCRAATTSRHHPSHFCRNSRRRLRYRPLHCTGLIQVFSRAGAISHPSMKPHKLGILMMVAINKKNFKPSLKDVKERYYLKFRSAAKDKPSASSDPGPRAPACRADTAHLS